MVRVGLAGAPIMDELKLTPEQFGFLGSSFFFLFAISAIIVGFIVNRVDTRWVLIVLAVIWSVAHAPGLAPSPGRSSQHSAAAVPITAFQEYRSSCTEPNQFLVRFAPRAAGSYPSLSETEIREVVKLP